MATVDGLGRGHWARWDRRHRGEHDPRLVAGQDVTGQHVTGQIVEVVGRFSSPSWEREVLCPSRFRFTEVGALDAFLSKAGFSEVEHYGHWDRRPFTDQRPEIITIARRG
jgi:hypothetical protein